MSKGNKSAKHRLEQIYGKKDMFVAADVETKLEILKIRSYRKFEKEQRFKGIPISQQLTFHHLRHRSEGGDASVYNGALIGYSHHQYMHSLPREEEEIINNIIREWKFNFVIMQGDGQILESGSITPDFSDYYTIPAYDTKEKKYMQHKHPSRAMKKRQARELIKESEIYNDDFEK